MGWRWIDQFHLAAESGFISIALIVMDGAFFYCLVNDRKSFREEFFGFFKIFVFYGGSQFFDLGSQQGFVPFIDGISA